MSDLSWTIALIGSFVCVVLILRAVSHRDAGASREEPREPAR
ncbi:hypothetical protein [Pseudonocardia spinosispora]|nr:hypothetical protein [Pseudonocardia spinosispora]